MGKSGYRHTSIQRGSMHIAVIACVVVALLCALGIVFYQNFMTKSAPKAEDTSTKTAEKPAAEKPITPKSEIIPVENSDMNRYVNHEFGFEFQFPKQTYTAVGCEDTTLGYDNYGNKKTVASHKMTTSGQADMTVLEGDRRYMITAKQAVILSDYQNYYMKCEVTPTTLALVDSNTGQLDRYVSAEYRTWEVAKVSDKDHIGDALSTLASFKGQAVNFTIGALENGRNSISYTLTNNPDNVGGGAFKLWYYPSSQLLVYIGLGQSMSFMKDQSSDEYYIGRIVDSFKITE